MKIVYTSTAYPPSTGGAQLHLHYTALEMSRNHGVSVLTQWDQNRTDWLLGTTIKAPGEYKSYSVDGLTVHRLGLGWKEKLQLLPFVLSYYAIMSVSLPRIAKCLERHLEHAVREADIIDNVRIGREALSYASLAIARKRGVPFVFRPYHHPRWTGWRYKAFIELYRKSDAVFALTNAERETLISLGVSPSRIAVIGVAPILSPNADPENFRRRYGVSGPFVLFLGQHYPYKGFMQVLNAAKFVWRRIPDVQFVFIGPPVGRSEQVFEERADPRIKRLGMLNLQEKTDALAACTLLCVPSTQESFGLVYTEAWYESKPVIGCRIPAVSEVITNGVDGWLVRQDAEEIAARICDLVLDEAAAQRMGAAGKQKVQERFTWEKIAEMTEHAYSSLLRRGALN